MVAAKKPTKKKMPVKKSAAKKSVSKAISHKKAHQSEWKTGKLSRDTRPFLSFTITSQTIIWAIFMAFVLIVQLIVLFKELAILDSMN